MAFASDKTRQGAAGVSGGYEIENSLRFNDDDSAYLSRTPSTAGNRKTWTYSAWVKRGNLGSVQSIGPSTVGYSNSEWFILRFHTDDTLMLDMWWGVGFQTNMKFRDISAWYHIVLTIDTTNATATDRVKLYVNGSRVTDLSVDGSAFALNTDYGINNSSYHYLTASQSASRLFDGYLAEVNFVDGQALTPSDFGETGDYGEWKPIEYSGTYGTNGFYLPMNQDYTVEGFSAVTYTGNGSSQYIGGTGFQPDFVWIKNRSNTADHALTDAVRGATKTLRSSSTIAEFTSTSYLASLGTDGFSLGSSQSVNASSQTYVAWNWDMGGSTVSNTDGSIISNVRANTDYGQSIVKWESHSSGTPSIGHGLNQEPELLILKSIDNSSNWFVHSDGLTSDSHYLFLDTTTAESNSVTSITTKDADTFTVGGGWAWGSGDYNVAYCFHSVSGYSKIGTYTGNGSTNGTTVTTGFKPAFVMVKRTDGTSNWVILDDVRVPYGDIDDALNPDESYAENTGYSTAFTSTGFQLKTTTSYLNANGGDYIYMAFADTRESAFWLDDSGNNNDWTPNNLTESDVSKDSPTNNFCTWNPLDTNNGAINITKSEGNLKIQNDGATSWDIIRGTINIPSSGKWYWEVNTIVIGLASGNFVGVIDGEAGLTDEAASNAVNGYVYRSSGTSGNNGVQPEYGDAYVDGDVVAVAYDADIGSIFFYRNNIIQNSGTAAYTGITSTDLSPLFSVYSGYSANSVANFGQDSSFAGNKTAQGNQDGNGYGDFYYAPPTGYLALCTQNLPEPTVVPSEHFNTVTYTGNGIAIGSGGINVTGVGFQPDFSWLKERSGADGHGLFDAVRGATKYLGSESTGAEGTYTEMLSSFDSDGFTVGNWSGFNQSSATYASWNWKANGAGVSNTNGTITSTVSANVNAGFSIVSYTGTSVNDETIGHGLSKTPELVITKNRDISSGWDTYFGSNDKYLVLSSTAAEATNTSRYGHTSSVLQVNTSGWINASGNDLIAYCFHSVEGYSKVGSYTGNGSTDGTFVHTGFRPAYVMCKSTDAVGQWTVHDSSRDVANYADKTLFPNLSNAEETGAAAENIDIISNGFKLRANGRDNSSGVTYIYIAFAEVDFKHSNAR